MTNPPNLNIFPPCLAGRKIPGISLSIIKEQVDGEYSAVAIDSIPLPQGHIWLGLS